MAVNRKNQTDFLSVPYGRKRAASQRLPLSPLVLISIVCLVIAAAFLLGSFLTQPTRLNGRVFTYCLDAEAEDGSFIVPCSDWTRNVLQRDGEKVQACDWNYPVLQKPFSDCLAGEKIRP